MMMVMMMIVLTTWSDNDCDGDDCADHTEVMMMIVLTTRK